MTQKDYISLVDRSKQLSYEYYVLAKPTVSDAQFDALVSEIEQAESEHPEWTLADSPTQMVGSDVDPKSGRRLIRHRTRMLSCQKAQTQEAVAKWMKTSEKKIKKVNDVHYVLEWKLDGISCSLVYQDGQLISAATRGNKDCGQDLLAHVKRMPSVPQHIYMDGRVEVRGEIVCPKANLAALGYKDCRTAAAALTNQMTPSRDMERLTFLAWQMDSDEQPFGTESAGMDVAVEEGFMTSGYQGCWGEDVLKHLDEFAARREALEWPTDGVVIKIDCRPLAQSMGCTDHHPKGSTAYKFPAQTAVTKVIGIEISIGATGRRTPRAILVPVMILGREVKSVSLGSENKMKELGVTEDCQVEVGLANDVTPYIYRVIEGADDGSYTKPEKSATDEDSTLSLIIVDAGNQRVPEEQTEVVAEAAAEVGSEGTPVPEVSDESNLPKIDGGDDAANDFDEPNLDLNLTTMNDVTTVETAEVSAVETSECEAEHSVLTDDTDGDGQQYDTDVTCGVCPIGVGEVQVREQGATGINASAGVGIGVTPAPEPFVSPEPVPAVPRSQREILAERRHQRRLERERMQRSYEERMEREAREAEQAAREEQRRNIFAAVGAVAVTAVMIYFFGLLGPAVFGLLCGGLLKG